jgi:hypothetical protein
MSIDKYEQRVLQRAEEFLRIYFKSVGLPENFNENRSEVSPALFSPVLWDAARLSVQREAEAYRMGHNNGSEYDRMKHGTIENDQLKQLQSLGLVP